MTFPRTTGPDTGSHETSSTEPTEPTSTTDVAKDQAGQVAGDATDAGKHVAGVAGEQANEVLSTATGQAKDLLNQTRGELTEQAGTQKDRVASGLRSISEELRSLATGSEQPGMVTDAAYQAAQRSTAVADWLEAREPGRVLDEVTRFARRKPGTFLAVAAGTGFLLGRFGKGLVADHNANDTTPSASASASASASGSGSGSSPTGGQLPPAGPDYGYPATVPDAPLYPGAPAYPGTVVPGAVSPYPEVGIVDPVTGRVGGVTP